MILIVTNKQDYTADYLIIELQRRATPYRRLNTEDLPQHLPLTWHPSHHGTIRFPNEPLRLEDITSIWYRRPVMPVPAPVLNDPTSIAFSIDETAAALDGVLRTLPAFWVSDPDRIRRAEHKPLQLAMARAHGLQVPATLLTSDPRAARDFAEQHQQIIYKPLRHARPTIGDHVSLIYTNPVPPGTDFSSVAFAPCLFQEYIPKALEIRTTVIGNAVLSVAIHSQEHDTSRHDWRRRAADQLAHEPHELPTDVAAKCQTLVSSLGLAFGAIDLIKTPDERYVFLEINPNGQWAWLQQRCPTVPLREALADLLTRCA